MEKYVFQLMESIKKAHRPVPAGNFPPRVISFEEEMEAVEKWASGDDRPPSLGYKCGLTPEQFPPPDKLTEDQMVSISYAFQEMLETWNLRADFPSNLPVSRAYPLLITILEKEAWYLPGGALVFDFCTGYAPDCEMKEYCPCLKYWNENRI
jgi:hypothetical protein